MFNKSIAYRLKIFISVAVIIVFIIFILLLFFFNLKLLRENIENRAITLSSRINAEISKDIFTTREVSLNIASQISYYNQQNDADRLLRMVMGQYPFLSAIDVRIDSIENGPKYFFVRRDRDQLTYHESNDNSYICHAGKEILNSVCDHRDQGWTNPYRCERTGNLLVSFYCPVNFPAHDGGTVFAGQVICELSLLELNNRINSIEIGKRGYAFIVNKNGDYISHPRKEWILERNMYKLPAGIIDTSRVDLTGILSGGSNGSFIAYPEMFNLKKSWVYHTPINQGYWMLFFVMPYNDLFKELYFRTLAIIIFAILGIIVIYQIITLISTKLIEPLSLVTNQLNKLHRPYGYGYPETQNEIRQVSDSLNYLRRWFDQYKEDQLLQTKKSNRLQQDMAQAFEIQKSFIKTDFSAIKDRKDIDLYAIYKPVGGVSGDLFDYFFLDDETLVFTNGDVSGTGVPAALFMSIAQAIIKKNASQKRAKDIVTRANKDLCTSSHHQFFLTLFLGVLNLNNGVLNYCNAAHTTTFILKSNGKFMELNKSHGLPLGLYSDKEYKDLNIKIEKGDTIVMYTDGVTTLENKDKEQYGINRLRELLYKLSKFPASPQALVMDIEKHLDEFRDEAPQADDICIFILKYLD
ncbi:MAG: SpoIIE family protein phosphatase [Prolixibacteraceae bacterium]|nr:SpoIIE family protein phosphatase [Prolixibacteraceae bacterium]MDD4756711.1 SpoIIE family protein phosphatase [Prolixibacteraceae bacterium]